jgi:adenylyltransferase/sulfurtransferase
VQFELGNIDGSLNIPFSAISSTAKPTLDASSPAGNGRDHDMNEDDNDWVAQLKQTEKPIFVVCRRGNDSQTSVRKMKELGLDYGGKRFIGDIRGGLEAWRKSVDAEFPDY